MRAATFIFLALLVLGGAYFNTQIIHTSDYLLRSDENRLRALSTSAPRGTIYDRNGEIVAQTIMSHALYLEPGEGSELRERLSDLNAVLHLDAEEIERLDEEIGEQRDERLLVSRALSFEQVSWIEEHRGQIPGVALEAQPVREYPEGAAVAHLVGHVAEISGDELADSAWAEYELGQMIGKSGLEREYEQQLGGTLGTRYIEVDARGHTVGQFLGERTIQPTPGEDLHLTLDVGLQRFARQIFPQDKRGAVVAMVPSTGEILAMYSQPTFDPNLLVGGVSPREWKQLNDDAASPLLNRATHGIYPPGSTWKLATALIGLEKGLITASTRMREPCTGGLAFAGRYSRCWYAPGHGFLDLAGAIAHSCNVYFYQLGIMLGIQELTQAGTRLGFARRTGIDLPSEASGIFPAGVAWYRARFGWRPPPSEVMNLAIGQGPNSQTPLRMAQFFSALAGNGTAPAPHLVQRPAAERIPETDLNVSPRSLQAVRVGLARVLEPGGTAHAASLQRWKLYGKTGTAQNTEDPKRPHAWFTGFAGPPGGEPEVVVAVIVERGESGSGTAAPLAAKIADYYLNRKHGFETQFGRQTLAERSGAAGRSAAPVAPPAGDELPQPQVVGANIAPAAVVRTGGVGR